MDIEQRYNVVVAEYAFGHNNIFEDIVNGQQSMHLYQIGLGGEFDLLPIPTNLHQVLEYHKEKLQKMLDAHAEKICKSNNDLIEDIKFKMVHLDCLHRIHSAVMCYRLVGYEFKPYKLLVWYITETIELDGFLETEVEYKFPYKEDNHEN